MSENLLNELKINKHIESEVLKKDFAYNIEAIEEFKEEWWCAMAGQKFAGEIWKEGEDWKYTLEDYPIVAKELAKNSHTNKNTIQYILFFVKGLQKDDKTRKLGYSVEDLILAHPIFPEIRFDIFDGGLDFYESMAGSKNMLPSMLKNPNYPTDGLMMIFDRVEVIDSKMEDIIKLVLSHSNFKSSPEEIKNKLVSEFVKPFYNSGEYQIIDSIELSFNCTFEKISRNNEYKDVVTVHGDEIDEAWRKFTINDAHISISIYGGKAGLLTILKIEEWDATFNLDELEKYEFLRSDQCNVEKLKSLKGLEISSDEISLDIIADIFEADDGDNYIAEDIDEEVVGNGFLFDNSLIDFEELPFKSADEDEIFDGLYLKMKVSLKEIYFNLNNENYHYSKDQFVDAIKIIK